jgi:hypothetical protein
MLTLWKKWLERTPGVDQPSSFWDKYREVCVRVKCVSSDLTMSVMVRCNGVCCRLSGRICRDSATQ